jgi:hypothetical protein
MAEKRHSETEADPVTLVMIPKAVDPSGAHAARTKLDPSRAITPVAPGSDPRVDAGVPKATSHDAERYKVRSVIGEGGMGRIHLTQDERVGRDVAMKVLRQRYSNHPDTVSLVAAIR